MFLWVEITSEPKQRMDRLLCCNHGCFWIQYQFDDNVIIGAPVITTIKIVRLIAVVSFCSKIQYDCEGGVRSCNLFL